MNPSRIVLIQALAILILAPAAARADETADSRCAAYEGTAEARIADCTAALAVPELDDSQRARLLLSRGWAHSDRSEYPEAAADFATAADGASFSERMMVTLLGWIKSPEAIDEATPFGDAYLGLSWMESTLGQYDQATANAEAAAKWFQSRARDSDAETAVAWAERMRGDVAAAEESYKQALQTYPLDGYGSFMYATLLYELGRASEALPLLKDAARNARYSGYPSFWLALRGDDREGEGRRAVNDYLDDAQSWPEPIGRYLTGAISINELLREAEAVTPVKTRENLCEAHFYIAEALRVAGKPDEARPHYQAVVDTGVTWYVEYAAARLWLAKN